MPKNTTKTIKQTQIMGKTRIMTCHTVCCETVQVCTVAKPLLTDPNHIPSPNVRADSSAWLFSGAEPIEYHVWRVIAERGRFLGNCTLFAAI